MALTAVVTLAGVALLLRPLRAQDGSPGSIRFIGHMVLGASAGEFRRWQITHAVIDDRHPEHSQVSLLIDLDSLDTHSAIRDAHLKSPHFFDVARYPTATITLSEAHVEDAAHFTADVEIEMHGRSKTVPMEFVILDRAARRIAGEVTLRRSDFGIGPPAGGVFDLEDEVTVRVRAVVPPPGVTN